MAEPEGRARVDVAIVGGGIAGLAAAWELARATRPRSFVLLEGASRPGGVIRTERTGGFVIEGGPDSILTQKPDGLALLQELGLAGRMVGMSPLARRLLVLHRGRLVALPDGLVLGIPRRAAAVLGSPLLSTRAKLRLALEPFIPARRSAEDESIAAFARRRLGREAAERLMEPLLAGIHAGDPERLSIRATFPRLADLESRFGSLTRGLAHAPAPREPAPPAFVSLPGGLAEMVEALVSRLPAEAIRTGRAVAALERTPEGFTLRAEGGAIQARAVLLCLPAPRAAELLDVHLPGAAGELRAIPFASSATVTLALPRAAVAHPLDASGVLVLRPEGMRSTAWTFVSSKFPGRAPEGHVLLRAFLGGARDPGLLGLDDDALVECARTEMGRLLGLAGQPVLARLHRWPRATPQMEVGHERRVAAIDAALAALGPIALAGGGLRATGLPDVIGDARRTVRGLVERLGPSG